MWSSHERQDWPAYGGEVSGFDDIKQGVGLDVVPSVSLSQSRDLVLAEDDSGFEPSLDVRYRITPSLSATFTLIWMTGSGSLSATCNHVRLRWLQITR